MIQSLCAAFCLLTSVSELFLCVWSPIHLVLPFVFIHVEDVLRFTVYSHSCCFSILVGGWGVVFPVYLWLILTSQFGIDMCFVPLEVDVLDCYLTHIELNITDDVQRDLIAVYFHAAMSCAAR